MNIENELYGRAIHEAGHAFMCVKLGDEIDFATIIPDKDGEYLACVKRKNEYKINIDDMSEENLNLLEQELKIGLAGYVSQKKVMGEEFGEDSKTDWGEAFCKADNVFKNSKIAGDAVLFCISTVEEIIFSEWSTVEAIANELLDKKTLSGKDIEKIVGPIEPIS
jgi:ATP-dependent Zn protease